MATGVMSSTKLQSSEYNSSFTGELDSNSMNSISSLYSNNIDTQAGDNSNQETIIIINHNHDKHNEQKIKIEIPKISTRDLQVQRPHSPYQELEQYGFLFNGLGAKRDPNKITSRVKNVEIEESIKRAKKYALEQSVRYVLVKQQQQQQKQQLDLIKKQQALLLMCRIYVGSIFYEVKEETVRMAFSAFGPIRSISMSWDAATNKHKGFAFIEFETPEAAQLALEQMNGVLLGGRNIKVGRPSNMPQAQPIIDQLTEEAKNYNRIYVASIHQDLTEQDVQSVFEAFGTIKSSTLVRDAQTGKHKGYGFIEYETTQAAQDAIASMNLFDLGGQFLRVGKAVTPPEGVSTTTPPTTGQLPTASALAAANITAQLQAQDIELTPMGALNAINARNAITQPVTNNIATSTLAGYGLVPGLAVPIQSPPAGLSKPPSFPTVMSPASFTGQTSVENSPTLTPTPITTTPKPPEPPQSTNNQAHLLQAQQTAALYNTMQPSSVLQEPPKIDRINAAVELTENQMKILGMTSTDDPSASLEQQIELTLKGNEQRLLLMQKLMQRKPESKVLILRNMVGPEDVDEYLESEITDECGKYGEVVQVIIYKEKQGEEEDAETIVKIFVEFTTSQAVNTALSALNGRFFAGRIVKAEIYDQNAYNSRDYSG